MGRPDLRAPLLLLLPPPLRLSPPPATDVDASGVRRRAPVIGVCAYALLSRGFHSACDAAFAMLEMSRESTEAGLVERAFSYDVMLHATFTTACIQPSRGWTADPLTRYVPRVTKGTIMAYEDPKTKRSHKGRAAIPPRYLGVIGASLAAMGKGSNVAPGMC